MRKTTLSFLFLLSAFTVALVRSPRAEAKAASDVSQRLAIVRLDFTGAVPAPLQKTLGERLVEGLTAVAFEVLPPGRGDSPVAGHGEDCSDASCLRKLADELRVRYLVVGRIGERDKTFEITLELVDGHTGGVVGTNRERCEICGAEEVGEKMSLAAATLRARLEALTRAPARIVVRTRPAGSVISVDGKASGRTPLDTTLVAGEHHMVIEHDGYSSLERSFAVTSGVDETLDLDLVPMPTRFPYQTAGWAAIGTGVALAVTGVYLLHIDGQEVGCGAGDKDGRGNCPRVYKTNVLAASMLGLSAVSATLGGVWLYLAPPSSGDSGERAFVPTFAVGARGRF